MSIVDNTIDLPWRNFLSPEFRTKFQREVSLFFEIPEFPYNTVWDRWKEASMPKKIPLDSSDRFDTIQACDRYRQQDRQTGGRTDRQTHDDSIHRASIASRSKNYSNAVRPPPCDAACSPNYFGELFFFLQRLASSSAGRDSSTLLHIAAAVERDQSAVVLVSPPRSADQRPARQHGLYAEPGYKPLLITACSQHLNWPELTCNKSTQLHNALQTVYWIPAAWKGWIEQTYRKIIHTQNTKKSQKTPSVVTRVSVTTWLAAAKLQCE